MNRRQLAVLWIGIGLVVGMGLIPPWRESNRSLPDHFLGYAPLWSPPEDLGMVVTYGIDLPRLVIQWVIAAALTLGAVLLMRSGGQASAPKSAGAGPSVAPPVPSSVPISPSAAGTPPAAAPPAPPSPPASAIPEPSRRWTTGPMSATERWSWVMAIVGWVCGALAQSFGTKSVDWAHAGLWSRSYLTGEVCGQSLTHYGVDLVQQIMLNATPAVWPAFVGLFAGVGWIAAGGAWHLLRERLKCRQVVGSAAIVGFSVAFGLVGAFILVTLRESLQGTPITVRFALLLPVSLLCFPLGGMIGFLVIRFGVSLWYLRQRLTREETPKTTSAMAARHMSDTEIHARAEAEVAHALAQARALEITKPDGWRAERKRLRRYADELRLLIGDDRYFAIERGAAPLALALPAVVNGQAPERFLWAPSGAAQFAAMFVEVPPGPPPTRERYLSMLGAKWDRMLSEESADACARFIGRTQSLFSSLPEPDSRSSFFADGREVRAREEWGSVLVDNDEVQEVLDGQGLLTGMNHPVSPDWHERLSEHGVPDLESILTVLENAEPSVD